MGLPRSTVVKNPPANEGDTKDAGSISGLGKSPGGGNGNLLQYSCLENPMDKGAWQATVHGVVKSWTRLSNWANTTLILYICGYICFSSLTKFLISIPFFFFFWITKLIWNNYCGFLGSNSDLIWTLHSFPVLSFPELCWGVCVLRQASCY